MNDDGIHIGGITGFFNTINVPIRQFHVTRCIVVFDGKGGSIRRRKIYEDYKKHRHGLRVRLNREYDLEDHTEEEKNAFRQLIRISDYLDVLPITTIIKNNVEADDVINYLAKDYLKDKVIIMSTDKDFVQLVDDRISVWNPPHKRLYNKESVKEYYGFTPQNFLYKRMIEGDKSDGVPGVKGIGEKTIKKHLPIICGDVDIEFYEFLDYLEKGSINNETIKKIYEKKDDLIRNYKLMKLGEIQMDGSTKSEIRKLVEHPVSITDNLKIKKLFLADKLYSVIPNIDSWLLLNYRILNAFAIQNKDK